MVPLFAPLRQNEPFFFEMQTLFAKILRSGEYVMGPDVAAFETALAENIGYQWAVGCASGAEALVLSLRAAGITAGDEVITPAFSFVASTNCIAWAGATPVFADVDVETGLITTEAVERAITPRTKAVIAVDIFGRQAPIAELRKLCDARALHLIEDGAQSIGVPNKGAHLYTLSFYPTKNLGALGDAGAVLTDSKELCERVQEISRHGGLVRDRYLRIGTTGRIDTLQAAFLSAKLPHLRSWVQVRQTLAHWYRDHLHRYEDQGLIWLPPHPFYEEDHAWALYTIRVPENRDGLLRNLRERGIGAAVYYPKAIPQQESLQQYSRGSYPAAEKLASQVLSLPLFPELTGKEFELIVKQLGECLNVAK